VNKPRCPPTATPPTHTGKGANRRTTTTPTKQPSIPPTDTPALTASLTPPSPSHTPIARTAGTDYSRLLLHVFRSVQLPSAWRGGGRARDLSVCRWCFKCCRCCDCGRAVLRSRCRSWSTALGWARGETGELCEPGWWDGASCTTPSCTVPYRESWCCKVHFLPPQPSPRPRSSLNLPARRHTICGARAKRGAVS
jgi:hypothetical protein